MTVISGLRCPKGVVLTADSRETRGAAERRVAKSVEKIYSPRAGFVIAWAGWQSVAQAFALAMGRDQQLNTSLDRLHVKRRLEALVKQIREEGETDAAEWLIAWWSTTERKAVALQLYTNRPGQWVSDWTFGGDPRAIDVATIVSQTLSHVPRETLTMEQAKILALKVIRDTILVGVDTIGGDPQVGTVTSTGTEVLSRAQLKGLDDTLDVWEAQVAELLPGAVKVPAESDTPDRGVRPPT